MVNFHFWYNKKVLITGYEGFVGSNLTKKLISLKAKIVGLDIKTYRKDTILTSDDYKKIVAIKGNVSNYQIVKKIIDKYRIEIIFHLAAESIVSKCNKNPGRAFNTNIKGTWEILEASRNSKTVKSIIIASSDKAYGSHKKLPYEENTPLKGDHPYDVSKSCADLIAYTYFRTYRLPVVITRCGNIYGPGDFNFSRIVPDTIRCILLNKKLLIRSNGKFIRDYIFIDDIIEGYILLAEKMHKLKLSGQAFNFSNEEPITVLELIKRIYKIVNRAPNYKILNEAKYEIKYQYLSSKKAKKILKWEPKYNLNEGLKKTIEFYKNHLLGGIK